MFEKELKIFVSLMLYEEVDFLHLTSERILICLFEDCEGTVRMVISKELPS